MGCWGLLVLGLCGLVVCLLFCYFVGFEIVCLVDDALFFKRLRVCFGLFLFRLRS